MNNLWEVYYVSNPTEAIGIPGHLHWNVAYKGDWNEGFRTKKEAVEYVKSMEKRESLPHRTYKLGPLIPPKPQCECGYITCGKCWPE